MEFTLEIEQEVDGRWIAEVPQLPGALAYGSTREEAIGRAKALALHVLADQIEHGERAADLTSISFAAA
ncbi:MAG: type II toxin-antitoxin system HicB family antitoxin [Actinomycetota bacterium]